MSRTRPGGGPLGRVFDWRPGPRQPYGPPKPGRRFIWEWPDQLANTFLTLPPRPGLLPRPGEVPEEILNSRGYWFGPKQALRFYAPTFAPYNDTSMPATNDPGRPAVTSRAIWQSPRFDMHPLLMGSAGITPNSYGIFQGSSLHLQVESTDAIPLRNISDDLRVYVIQYLAQTNPNQLQAIDFAQDVTQEFWNANDGALLQSQWPGGSRYWSIRYVFDYFGNEGGEPLLFTSASVV